MVPAAAAVELCVGSTNARCNRSPKKVKSPGRVIAASRAQIDAHMSGSSVAVCFVCVLHDDVTPHADSFNPQIDCRGPVSSVGGAVTCS